jgi:hypothetical protein
VAGAKVGHLGQLFDKVGRKLVGPAECFLESKEYGLVGALGDANGRVDSVWIFSSRRVIFL